MLLHRPHTQRDHSAIQIAKLKCLQINELGRVIVTNASPRGFRTVLQSIAIGLRYGSPTAATIRGSRGPQFQTLATTTLHRSASLAVQFARDVPWSQLLPIRLDCRYQPCPRFIRLDGTSIRYLLRMARGFAPLFMQITSYSR